ncbi:MAG: SpoIIE family protein phosphatase [Nostocales cyanobacterium 94392]|nr:SpoIIE family protein phosphatase [Nostocales cyanobacterium 94392]
MENNSPLILIADDDRSTRIVLKLILQQDGYQVMEVDNGEECLNVYKDKQPDMVLLDAIMPIMDGFTCCEKLQSISNNDLQVPVLMITGLDSQESVDKAFNVGATDYITKPIHPPVLRQRLRRLLQAHSAEKALRASEHKYRSVVNNLKEVIFQVDLEGNLTFLNPAWQEITGFSIPDSLGKNFLDFIHPGDHQSYLAHNDILLNQNKNQQSTSEFRYQLRYLHCNGTIGWVEIYTCLMVTTGNNITGISGTLNDITEVKRQEAYQKTEYKITKILAESQTIQEAIPKIIQNICENFDWGIGELWSINYQKNILELIANWSLSINEFTEFVELTQTMTLKPGVGLPGIVWENHQSLWVSNLTTESRCQRILIVEKIGLKSSFSIPINSGKEKLGVMTFFSRNTKHNDTELLHFMVNIGSQIAQFIKRKQAEEESQHWTRMLQSELEQAAKYVGSLLPNPTSVALNIEQQFVPSSQLGGDIFDYYWLDENHLVLYLLDVAGHGVRSALLSVSVLNILRTQSLLNTNFYRPTSVLKELNRVFQMNYDYDDSYFTLWYGVYNKSTQKLVYASAGHPPAILFTPCSTDISIQKLFNRNIAIGLFPDINFEQDSCILPKDSQLYIFSDGVYEITQHNGKIWGLEALIELLKYHQSYNLPLENILKYIQSLNNKTVLEDDFSLLRLTIN